MFSTLLQMVQMIQRGSVCYRKLSLAQLLAAAEGEAARTGGGASPAAAAEEAQTAVSQMHQTGSGAPAGAARRRRPRRARASLSGILVPSQRHFTVCTSSSPLAMARAAEFRAIEEALTGAHLLHGAPPVRIRRGQCH